MKKLLLEILTNRDDVEVNLIMLFCEDILWYLEDDIEDEDEYETNQHYFSMKELFRGYVVLDWLEVDLRCRKYKKFNKIVVKRCVEFYNECWKNRNEVSHNKIK